MKYGLNIPRNGALDLLSLGAVVHRLDPGIVPFRKAAECKIHVSGGEYNVAANLSDCFGLQTGIATAMVDYPIGDLVAERVRAMGVRPFYKHFKHDGVRGPNLAAVYSDRGCGVRAPVVFYNRCNEAAAQLKPGDFNWTQILAGGLRWFHSGGIFAALSPTTAELIIEGMEAAKAARAVVSFDLDYRAKLWNISGGHERAAAVLERIVRNVDVLVGNEEDLQLGLGIAGPAVAAQSKLDPRAFSGMIHEVDCGIGLPIQLVFNTRAVGSKLVLVRSKSELRCRRDRQTSSKKAQARLGLGIVVVAGLVPAEPTVTGSGARRACELKLAARSNAGQHNLRIL